MDMQVKYEQSLSVAHSNFGIAEAAFDNAVLNWLSKFMDKLNGNVHFLVFGQVEISSVDGRTKYSRTADLCMRATSGDKQKVLKSDVVLFSVDWPDPAEKPGDDDGKES